jgi:hypothetical protein
MNITMYIGVEVFDTKKLSILATVEEVIQAKVGIKYDVDFSIW